MSPRLLAELTRLFPGSKASGLAPDATLGDGAAAVAAPTEPGAVRWLVLGLHHTAGAEPLGRVWQGMQTELALPAPALAVDGQALLQLWLPLAEPVPVATAAAWLAAVRQRWLADLPGHQIHTWPAAPAQASDVAAQAVLAHAHAPSPAPALPPQALGEERWSAFVSPDLMPVFADTPWLDLPPGDDAQAALLSRVVKAAPQAWRAACATLGVPASPQPQAQAAPATGPDTAPGGVAPLPSVQAFQPGRSALDAPAAQALDGAVPAKADALAARRFLRQVMDDPQQPLAQRIEAARVLLAAAPPGG